MSVTTSNIAVVSPTDVLHAVRPGVEATACGLNFRRKRRRAQNGRVGWVRLVRWTFEQALDGDRPACQRCRECLAEGMGPGA